MAKLTVKKVAGFLSKGKPGKHLDSGSGADSVRGLHLVVVNKRNASWQLRYQVNKRTRWMGLGSARDVPLAKARERARREREKLVDKIDPLAVRRAERAAQAAAALKAITFAEAAKAFIEQNEAGWKNAKHRSQVLNTLKEYAFPIIGALPVADIDTPQVLKVLRQPVAAKNDFPAGPFWNVRAETASRVRGRVESVLGWATVSGYRSGDNPARWRGHLDQALPKRSAVAPVEHYKALPYAQVPAFVAKLREREGIAAQALMFTILTGARTGETIRARWGEINLQAKVWTVPPEHQLKTKKNKEHRVPLSPQAVRLLQDLPREANGDDGFIFIGAHADTGLSNGAMDRLLQRMNYKSEADVHGFRSSFMDWAHEQTAYPKVVIDMALAHTVGDKVEAAYRRGDLLEKRQRLMRDWARYACSEPVSDTTTDTDVVVPMGGRR